MQPAEDGIERGGRYAFRDLGGAEPGQPRSELDLAARLGLDRVGHDLRDGGRCGGKEQTGEADQHNGLMP